MERNRETRRASILGSNGFNRRRQRTNSLRDSPDEDGGVEFQESVRLRDRVKKDRDRERERDFRERPSRSKRRRGDDETSEESINDDEDIEYEENTANTAAVRLLPPLAGSVSNHHHSHSSSNNHHLQHRKSFPPGFSYSSSKAFRASPVWKPGDEIISVSVPRKARSANTKRSHDWISSSSNKVNGAGAGGSEQILRQASSFPARQSGIVSTSTPLPAAPMSPPPNSFLKKKLKPYGNNFGPELKSPKASSSKQNPSNPEELEIEIAEVLYGLMTQPQGPPSSRKYDSIEVNRSNGDGKSSPISNSGPLQAVATKRKRHRQVVENPDYSDRPGPISIKVEMDQASKTEISSPNLEKIPGSTGENGFEVGGNSVNSQGQPPEPPVAEELIESRDLVIKEDMKEKESCAVKNEDNLYNDSSSVADTMIKANSMVTEVEIQRELKFEIDLMGPPRQARSSPDRAAPLDQKPILSTVDAESKLVVSNDKENEEEKSANEKSANVTEAKKEIDNNMRNIDLQFDMEKPERNENAGNIDMASWPGGLPPMGYMAPLQGVVPMNGTAVTPSPIQPLFTQPRPKRCATHCYIARNIHCLQQFMKTNPFWQVAAGPASLFGSKSCNLNVIPADPVGNMAGRGVSNGQDKKGQSLASSPNHGGKDKDSQTVSSSDSVQRKQQIQIQQTMPSVGPSNLLGPAFIFPLNQQQAASNAASARPISTKPPSTTTSDTSSSNPSSSAGACASVAEAAGTAAAMSFNYPPMAAANETQYLRILQNNSYPFPIPAVGAHPPNYRGPPSQAMPLFNGSLYPSQMIIQHHQQTPSTQSPWQAHQNATASNASSSSQKNLPRQQPRPQSSGVNSGAESANLQNFPGRKSQLSNNQHGHPSRPRRLESEPGREDSPTTTESRGSRAPVNIYGLNFAMPIHPQNFALMNPPAPVLASGGSSNESEKKPQQFAMSFGTINGYDITSMAQNDAIFQSFPEATRQNIQMMAAASAAAQVAQKNNNFRISEDDKSRACDSLTNDAERKCLSSKAQGSVGQQSIAFMRSDLADPPVSSIQATNVVIESLGRSVNVSSGAAACTSRPVTNNVSSGAINVSNVHIQGQLQQQLKQQQTAINRSKTPVTSNMPVFSEHLNLKSSSIMAAKFPNALSNFPQNLVQSNNGNPAQSPQWSNTSRTPISQAQSSSTTTTLKNQHSRPPTQTHNQISFGGNKKPSTTSQVKQAPTSPTNSSVSKGSPRTTSSTSTNTKMGQSPIFSAQHPKNSPSSNPSQKFSSILGNPNVAKTPMQPQLFFSNPYSQVQSPHSTSTSSATSDPNGFYMQRGRPEQHQQPGPPTSSNGVLSLGSPVKAIAAATSNVKAGGLNSQGIIHAAQFGIPSGGALLSSGFSYVHTVPAAVQVKPAEQKQPAGNDNLHPWQPEKK